MKTKDEEIVKKVHLMVVYGWNTEHAIQYAPLLFPFIEPEKKVRDAMKALTCKHDKDRELIELRLPLLRAGDNAQIDANQLKEDINKLFNIYEECRECSVREICKNSFPVVSEYVSYSLKKLDFAPSENVGKSYYDVGIPRR